MLVDISDGIWWCVDTILQTCENMWFFFQIEHFGLFHAFYVITPKPTFFQKSIKSYLHTIRWHPRYLQASSKYKQCIFEKFKKFDIFDAFLYSKRPKSKIQKNRKKCIFFKKSNFFKGLSGHHRCSEMVQNSPPKCSKHISNQYLMFTSILDHFLKNRKNSIFEKKFRACINEIGRIYFSRPNIGQISFGIE